MSAFTYDDDTPIPLPAVPDVLKAEYNRVVTRQTVWHWTRHGLSLPNGSRVKLQSWEIGRKKYTTLRWLRWFLREES